MPVRPIVPIGHPVLRTPTTPIQPEQIGSPEIESLIDDLIDTMRHERGAGVAANQIGVSKRVTVIEVTQSTRYPYKPPIPLTVAINPIVELVGSETVVINEGCLSVPLRGELVRNVVIRVEYLDRDGMRHDEVKRGLTAGTWQHECDHLDGRLIVDRIDPTTLSTWEQYELHHRAAFVERITRFTDEIGS